MKTKSYLRYIFFALGLGLSLNGNVSAVELDQIPPRKKINIDKQPEDQLVKYGQAAQFEVVADIKKGASYQWTHNLMPIPDATKPILSINKVSRKHLGSYACIITVEEEDQPVSRLSDPVTLTAYKTWEKKLIVEYYVIGISQVPFVKDDVISARTRAAEDQLRYAVADLRFPLYSRETDSAPLRFVSGTMSTNSFSVDYLSAGGAGTGSGTCPPAYKCYFNFKKSSGLGWRPEATTTPVSATHLQSSQTVVKWFMGTQSGCGSGGTVTINNPNTNGLYKFTVYCPTAIFSSCLTGLQQLQLTGLIP
jgi:hypothetical protein